MKKINIKKISIIVICIWGIFIATDFTLSKFNKDPIFSIPTKLYRDGGSVAYYGIGYKIIKYRVMRGGRNEVVFGFWTLKYEK